MSFTLDAARNYAIPRVAHSLGLENHTKINTSNLFALPSPLNHAYTKRTHLTRSMYGLPCLTNFQHKDEKDNRSRVIVRCEMAPKGRGSSEPSPGHDEQQYCAERKHTKREHVSSDHHMAGHDEQQHHPVERKTCSNRRAEAAHPEVKPGSEWHDIFHDELREWKGMRGPEQEEHCEEEAYPEYTPRHGGGGDVEDEGRACTNLRESDKGYVIKVSKELMGLFCYIEKRKRSMIKELAHTLRQVQITMWSSISKKPCN